MGGGEETDDLDDPILQAIAHAPPHRPPGKEVDPARVASSETPISQAAGALEHRRASELEELAAATMRFRKAHSTGIAVWLAFSPLDILVNVVFELHHLLTFVALRLAGAIVIGTSQVMLAKRPPRSLDALRARDMIVCTAATCLISVMCTQFWGLASPYAPGICLVLAQRMVISHDPWRKALVTNGVPALAFPLVLLIAAWIDPVQRSQLHDGRVLALFSINGAFVLGMAEVTVNGSHIVWSLRRQLFEARKIGRYKLKRRLGAGGMGEVWLAYDRVLKRDLALKFLRSGAHGKGDGAIARFEREVHATAELTHLNTVRVFDYGTTADGLCYYAMEHLEGETLTSLVLREGPLPPRRALSMILQAARALGEAHARGIVHRDVKPDNLFVTTLGGEKDIIKVLDFGIAMVTRPEADLTATGSLLGTPAYLSPEVAAGRRATAQSDVYCLGAVLYFLLCGERPFEASNARLLVQAHLVETPIAPSVRLGKPLPPDLEAVVLACLAKEPSARFASAAVLAAALETCESGSRRHYIAQPEPSDDSA